MKGNIEQTNDIIGVAVGFYFGIVPCKAISHIRLTKKGEKVIIKGKEYELYKGKTFGDSQMLNKILDQYGDYPISQYCIKI